MIELFGNEEWIKLTIFRFTLENIFKFFATHFEQKFNSIKSLFRSEILLRNILSKYFPR